MRRFGAVEAGVGVVDIDIDCMRSVPVTMAVGAGARSIASLWTFTGVPVHMTGSLGCLAEKCCSATALALQAAATKRA